MTQTLISQNLRENNRPAHDLAESQEFQRQLMAGSLPREEYVAFLEQSLLIHQALEQAMPAVHGALPETVAMLTDQQVHSARIEADLQILTGSPANTAPTAMKSTAEFLGHIRAFAASRPVVLLGIWYVLEGSKNGGKFLARAVEKAYGLEPRVGSSYMDPYGSDQQTIWRAFKETLDGLPLADDQRRMVEMAANHTFLAVTNLCREIVGEEPLALAPAKAGGCPHAARGAAGH